MFPDGFESLSLDDNILVARINLCAAAVALLVFAVFVDAWDWPARSLAIAAAAGLIFVARQIETVFRRAAPARRAAPGLGALSLSTLGDAAVPSPALRERGARRAGEGGGSCKPA